MTAVPGLPYPITYMNYIVSELKYTQFKDLYYDADGNVVLLMKAWVVC
jgi:hypothetical protein